MMNQITFRIIRGILGLAGLAFVVFLLIANAPALVDQIQSSNPLIILASIVIALTGNLLLGSTFTRLLVRSGTPVSPETGIKVFMLSQLAKYIPGKIWPYILQMTHLPSGSSIRSMMQANLDLMFISIWRNITLGIALILLYSDHLTACIFILIFGLVGSFPLARGVHWRALIFLYEKISGVQFSEHKPQPIIKIVIEIWLAGILVVLGQLLLLSIGININPDIAILLVGISLLSWVFSVVLIIFPAGIGVRELGFIKVAEYFGVISSIAAPVILLLRFWWILVDLLGGLIMFMLPLIIRLAGTLKRKQCTP